MLRVLEVTFPVFALVFCGFFGQRWKLLPERAVDGLNAFVYYFALPAMLFRVIATQPLSGFTDYRFAIGYALSGLGVFLFTRAAAAPSRKSAKKGAEKKNHEAKDLDAKNEAARVPGNHEQQRDAIALGMTAAHSNLGYLGIPLILELGQRFAPTIVLAILCDITTVILLSIALLELNRRRAGPGDVHPLRLLGSLLAGMLKSPLIFSIALGLLWGMMEPPMPDVMENFIRILSSAAGPCALFAIGASLGNRPIELTRTVRSLLTIKLVVHPALAALMLYGVVRADPASAAIGVLAASLPGASNSFIIAQRYGVDTREISAAIVAGTFIGLITVSTVIWLLGLRAG